MEILAYFWKSIIINSEVFLFFRKKTKEDFKVGDMDAIPPI